MKIRQGFVSNSSSSSFIIGYKGELEKDNLIRMFGGEKDTVAYGFSASLADYIINNHTKVTIDSELDDYGYSEEDGDSLKTVKLMKEGYNVIRISASYNESDHPIEMFLGSGGVANIETEDFVFKGEY